MQQAILTVDLGFGDAGKGSIVDFLTRQRDAHTVVRYNGGAQAAHRVVTPDGREHVFAQFGSGTLAGAATHLSRFMLIDPLAMLAEAAHLHALGVDALERTTIDERALIITPFQRAANRLKELGRGAGRHGSCGMGVGETMADFLAHGERVLFAGDLVKPHALRAKLAFLQTINQAKIAALRDLLPDTEPVARELDMLHDDDHGWLLDACAILTQQAEIVRGGYLHTLLARPGTVIFEGAQGVLLDEWRGFHPYTTWSTTTLANAEQLLYEAGYTNAITRLGITRAYATRHGAGPFVTEDAGLTAALPDARNGAGAWQGGFRVGWPDLVMLRYALDVTGPLDALAVTCVDRLAELAAVQICTAYQDENHLIKRIAPSPEPHMLAYQEQLTAMLLRCQPVLETLSGTAALLKRLAAELGVPIGIISEGPTAAEKRHM
jgi:adenylosuccinate synthase